MNNNLILYFNYTSSLIKEVIKRGVAVSQPTKSTDNLLNWVFFN